MKEIKIDTGNCFSVILVDKLRPATLLKKGLWKRCFPENFAKF